MIPPDSEHAGHRVPYEDSGGQPPTSRRRDIQDRRNDKTQVPSVSARDCPLRPVPEGQSLGFRPLDAPQGSAGFEQEKQCST